MTYIQIVDFMVSQWYSKEPIMLKTECSSQKRRILQKGNNCKQSKGNATCKNNVETLHVC